MPQEIHSIDQENFDKAVLQSNKPVLVDFWAPWCAPCRAIAPIIEELANEYQGKMEFAKVNVDQDPFIASKYGVMSIPTLIVFKSGRPVEHAVGYQSREQLKKILDRALGK